MCYRHERRVEPASRDDPARVPPLLAPRLRRPAAGVALVAALAVAAAVLLPDALSARPGTPEPQPAVAVERAQAVPMALQTATAGTAAPVGGNAATLPADDEVPPVGSKSDYGGYHHD